MTSAIQGAKAETRLATAKDGSKGYVCELSVSLSSLGVSAGAALRCLAVMEKDNNRTMFSFANGTNPNTWQIIKL